MAIQHLSYITIAANQGRALVGIGPYQRPSRLEVGKHNPQYGQHLPLETKISYQGRQPLRRAALALEQQA
jgi:hypothetical protein